MFRKTLIALALVAAVAVPAVKWWSPSPAASVSNDAGSTWWTTR